MGTETHAHVLGLQKHLVTPGPALAPRTRGLGPAKGLAQVAHVLAVDEAHPGLDGGGHAVRAGEILAPDVAAQSIARVIGLRNRVGLVIEGNEARHWPEDLLL